MNAVALRWSLVVITVVGLAVDVFVHLDRASDYDAPVFATTTMSQGDLFRLEAIFAIIVGLALIIRPRWWTAIAAALVAGGGAALLLLYRYVDVGSIGPIPNMYEPTWNSDGKTLTFVAQIVAAVTALALVPVLRGSTDRSRRPAPTPS